MWILLAAALAIPGQGLPERPARNERLRGRYERVLEWTEPATRQTNLGRINVGAWGRSNATRDEARRAETPSLAPRPLSDW